VNAPPRQTHLPVGPLVAACGAVLLVVSLFLDWYDTFSAFTVFEFLDLLLVMLALASIASLVGGLGLVRPAVPAGLVLAVAILALIVVVTQIVNHPPAANGLDNEIGIWLALAGTALMVAGAVLGYAHISLAVETRPRTAAPRPGRDEDETNPLADPAAPPRRGGPGRERP
jgi:hypothetical protein